MKIEGFEVNPQLDLVLDRTVDVPVELVWKAWTEVEHLVKWFVPKPWSVAHCEVDLRPGGKFNTVMRSPEGQEFPGSGCYLEVLPNKRLVWTSALLPGFRPAPKAVNTHELLFTAVISLEAVSKGTRYTVIAIHPDPETCKAHSDMGFTDGWGTCLDQLVECIKNGEIA
ncbi:MAG: SRPBCC family protein [Planctomycetes bacterium]|nr:SRPBCC family protein [Planctomycetota bacterium]